MLSEHRLPIAECYCWKAKQINQREQRGQKKPKAHKRLTGRYSCTSSAGGEPVTWCLVDDARKIGNEEGNKAEHIS